MEPGWETDYESRPPVAPYACLGKVVTHHKLPDGRYNLLLMGVGRIRIAEEMPPLRSFRQAKVELLREKFVDSAASHVESLQRELMDALQQHMPCGCQAPEQLSEMFADQLPLSMMTDLAAYALPLATDAQAAAARRVSRRRASAALAQALRTRIVAVAGRGRRRDISAAIQLELMALPHVPWVDAPLGRFVRSKVGGVDSRRWPRRPSDAVRARLKACDDSSQCNCQRFDVRRRQSRW